MTLGTWAFLLVGIVAIVAAITCGIFWKVAYDDGHEAGQLHERNLRSTRLLRERREARENREIDEWDTWAAQLRENDGERLADTGEMKQLTEEWPMMRTILDDPGQPDNLTTTGAFRALTDDWIAQMTAEEARYRKDLAS
jgi:hypothetical protein